MEKIDINNRTCYYFHDIIEFKDCGFNNIILIKKSSENILHQGVSYETSIGGKPLRIRFDKVDGFIRVQDGATYIESFDPEEDDAIFDRIRCLATQKSGIAYAIFHNLQ